MKAYNNEFALITGAGSGIGKSLAVEYASRKSNLILVALPGDGLQTLGNELQKRFGVKILCYEMDLTRHGAPLKLYECLAEENIKINLLINNAGIGYENCFENLTAEYCDNLIRLNIQVVVLMTWLFIGELKKCKDSKILNVSSLASYAPIPYKSIYAASKSFVYSFSRSLNTELKNSGIKVCVLCPGPVLTNELVRERISAHKLFSRLTVMLPRQVAIICASALDRNQEIIIPGFANRIICFLMKLIPDMILLQLLSMKSSRKLSSDKFHATPIIQVASAKVNLSL